MESEIASTALTVGAAAIAVAATNGISEHERSEEDDVRNVEFLEEGDGAAITEEEEMGEAEYLDGEMEEQEIETENKIGTDALTEAKKIENDVLEDAEVESLTPRGSDVDEQSAGVESDEGELITGDDTQAEIDKQRTEDVTNNVRSGSQKTEEQVDENQCRVCTSKEEIVSLFKPSANATDTPADMLLIICPSVSIAAKDFMPQFICNSCLDSVTIAIQLKNQLETTERELRKRLSRSKNKVRRPRGYVVVDAPVSDSVSEEEELIDDVEFKVSDVAGSSSVDSDSADSDISEKRKRSTGRRRRRKKPNKRSVDAVSGNDEDLGNPQKKKCLTPPAAQVSFDCDQCDLSFTRKQSLILHRRTHDTSREINCEICNKKFKVYRAYKAHLDRHELEQTYFQCNLCVQVFKLRAELKRHMATTHDDHGVVYECKRCQRTFLNEARLHRHQRFDCPRLSEGKNRRNVAANSAQGQDLFKSVAPLTTTYWSDSFSD